MNKTRFRRVDGFWCYNCKKEYPIENSGILCPVCGATGGCESFHKTYGNTHYASVWTVLKEEYVKEKTVWYKPNTWFGKWVMIGVKD